MKGRGGGKTGDIGVTLGTPLAIVSSTPGEVGGEVRDEGGVKLLYFWFSVSGIRCRGGRRRCTGIVEGTVVTAGTGVTAVTLVVVVVVVALFVLFSCSCACLNKNCVFTL